MTKVWRFAKQFLKSQHICITLIKTKLNRIKIERFFVKTLEKTLNA